MGKEKDREWKGNLGLRNIWKVDLKWKEEVKNEVIVTSFHELFWEEKMERWTPFKRGIKGEHFCSSQMSSTAYRTEGLDEQMGEGQG